MIGEVVSHYRVLEQLGGGAMGVVYKAQDLRLKRLVALKFLPAELTRDPDAKKRFIQEAEAASALDNPNVCTVHDIDETADGRVFIAMGFYEGETLKSRIQRGRMPVDDVVNLACQIAGGLAAAHDAGITHRDIKPANVMVTTRGEAKIVDFGIAKLAGQTDLTGTGLRLGTVAYMAPEQFEGTVDARSDLWALGVVMFEMLTGRKPFEGADGLSMMNAVLNRTPPAVRSLRADVPEALAAIVDRAMQKDPARRFSTAREMAAAIDACRPQAVTAPARDDSGAVWQLLTRPFVAVPVLLVIVAVAYAVVSMLVERSRAQWVRDTAIPQIRELLQRDDYDAAYALTERAEAYVPDDPMLAELMSQITQAPALTTRPEGARVFVKPYNDAQAEWRLVGTTPLKDVALPRGAYRWRIEADGFDALEIARNVGDFTPNLRPVDLQPHGTIPDGMVPVPAGLAPVRISGFATENSVALEPFVIDRHEVTNRQFKAFMDAGGYAKREYWKHDFVDDGRRLTWEEGIALFHDSSGRPGPAKWELGNYPPGQDEYPVTGVSWYEAAAYAEFRGAQLPTIYHWARAGLEFTNAAPIRGRIIEASNYDGTGPVAVESSAALGPYGAFDMAGNVREWCANLSGQNRWILGGAWNDHDYMYTAPYALPPMDRSQANGFRLAKYADNERVAELSAPIDVFRRDFRTAKPVSDEVFEVFKRQFAYTPVPPDARVESTDAAAPDWVRETVSIDTGYGERLTVHIFIPKTGAGPRQTVVFFPGLGQYTNQASSAAASPATFGQDFIVKSNRIFVMPVFKGSYERFDGFVTLTGDRYLQTFRQRMREWRQEVGQLLDYLATRPDVAGDKFGWSGVSFGSSVWLSVMAMEPRFQVAVLQLAGLSYRDMLPEVDAVNFVSRITIPVLMLEGRYDHLFPVAESQEPLFALLGTPTARKKMVHFDAGHGPLPRGQVIHEMLTWLDTYLGRPE